MTSGGVIGTIRSGAGAVVDGTGRVTTSAGVTLDWWVGAADRWHLPAEASGTAVGQRRIDGTPVVETSLRVPGGQLVHRAWGAAAGRDDVVVVELENRSRDAVAVALVVTGRAVAHDGDRGVTAAGRAALTLARRPARTASGPADAVRATVVAGEAPVTEGATTGAPALALVLPLAHTARLRLALPLGGGGGGDTDGLEGLERLDDLAALADADSVVAGWRAHLDAGVRLTLPDEGLVHDIASARCGLLLLEAASHRRPPAEVADIARALDEWGHHAAAASVLAAVRVQQRLDGSFGSRRTPEVTAAVLAAWARHATSTGDAAFADDLVEPAAKAAHRLGKVRFDQAPPAWWVRAQVDAADLLDRAHQPEAAALCRARAGAPTSQPAAGSAARAADPAARSGGGAGSAPVGAADPVADARFLLHARGALVDDSVPGALALLPSHPAEWLGRDLDVHDLPTRVGRLSFAIRWHGARPALLWELDGAATLTVPGLDPAWSTADPAGEALLGAVEPAGGLPKVVAPLAAEGTRVDEAPPDGVSFR